MPYGCLTVGELKAKLADIPDNAVVLVRPSTVIPGEIAGVPGINKEKIRALNVIADHVTNWAYNSREVHNAYSCNDDRYTPSSAFLIELGDFSP